jgi:hypothetical protein
VDMPGLLDFFGTGSTPPNPDATVPQLLATPMGQGLLGAVASYAANARRGAPVNSIGAGLLGGLSAFSNAGQEDLRRRYMTAQMDDMAQQQELRRAQVEMLRRKQATIDSVLPPSGSYPSQPTVPGQLGSGSFGVVAPTGGAPAIPAPAPRGVAGLTPDALARLKLGADVDLTDIYKLTQPDMQVSNGYAYDKRTLKPGFIPQANVSQNGQATVMTVGQDGMPRVSMPPGALESYSAFRNADEAAKAGSDLVRVVGADGAERYVTRKQAIQATNPRPATPARPVASTPGDADRYAILTQELERAQQAGNTGDVAAIQREISRLPASARTTVNPSGLAVPFQASPTTAQAAAAAAAKESAVANAKLPAQAGDDVNKTWLKSSYEPTLASGNSARDLLDTVRVTRQAMENMGATGWGTQSKAVAAAILSGMGIAPKNAQIYASNAQVFQKTAMDRLWTTLNDAKGPQTEGDADRARQTYGSLSNTPQANAFILDLTEAKAQRDAMKAAFFQQALPIARERGDLQEVEREWQKRAPSIFSLPSMRRWSGGIK